MSIRIRPLTIPYFSQVIALGNHVHGDGYLDAEMMHQIATKGSKDGINANFVALDDKRLIGFRLTYAPGSWTFDRWCTPASWSVPPEQLCYFKCNTVAKEYRGQGVGGSLLRASIAATKKQGAIGGLSHLWKQSPDNSAVGYFTRAGGRLIKEHPNRWSNNPDHPDYVCVLCGESCHCTACEMLLLY